MRKRKSLFRAAAAVMAAVMAFSFVPSKFVKADSVDGEQYLALGADLSSKEKQTVLELLGVSDTGGYTMIKVTNKEEHEYLGDYLSSKVIGLFRAAAAVMAAVMAFSFVPSKFVKADSVDGEQYLALGADLSSKEKQTVLELLGVSDTGGYTMIKVTNKEEHEYLGDYLSSKVIGSRALSSVTVKKTDSGSGVNVQTENITYCTEGMYKNALVTAGIKDADVKVAGPFKISGTAALVGVMKSYEAMTGKKIPEKSKDAATDELITTGEVAESIGKDDAEKLIADVKQKVAEDNLKTPQEIGKAIDESAKDLEINLSDADRQKIQELMDKISDLNLNVDQLKEQAKDIYNKLNDSGFFEKVKNWFSGVVDTIKGIFS